MHIKKTIKGFLIGLSLSLLTNNAWSQTVIIVSNKSSLTSIKIEQVMDIFLGQLGNFPDGSEVEPLDQSPGTSIRNAFYLKVASRSPTLMKAYWSKMLFTGRGQPPRVLSDIATIKKMVSNDPRLIAYIDKDAVDSSVKVILTLP